MWERTLDIIGIILKVISMAEKIIPGAGSKRNDNNGNIIIILTPEEYEVFRNACLDLLDYHEMARGRARKIKKILEKLEEARK